MFTQILRIFPFLERREHQFTNVTIGSVALVFVVLSGATSTTFAKVLAGNFSPFALLFVSEFIALSFTVLSFGLLPLISQLTHLKKEDFLPLSLIGISNSVLAPILVFTGLRYANALNAELFLRSHTLFLFVLAIVFLGEKVTRTHILAASSIILGILIVGLRGFESGLTISVGDTLILSGAVLYASGTVLFKLKLSKLHPEVFIFSRGLMAMMFFFVSSPFMEHTFVEELIALPYEVFGVLIAYGFISRFIYLFSFYEAVERLQVHVVSLVMPLVTVGSLIFASIYLGEHIQWYHIMGALCILGGTLIMRFSHTHFSKENLEAHLKDSARPHV